MTTFGNRLRDARKKMKLSQEAVAKRVGMSQSLISELENDEYPTSGYTPKLARLYKVNASWLADGVGSREISDAEALEDENVLILWSRYNSAPDATKALIDYLLQTQGSPAPSWMSPALKSLIENARELVAEQMKNAPDLER